MLDPTFLGVCGGLLYCEECGCCSGELGKGWVAPHTVGADNRRQGYLRGLRYLGWLALPAVALLIVGAVYEAFSLRYFVHPLAEWLL